MVMTFTHKFILATTLVISAQPALSLSCLPPDVARTFNSAAQSEDQYVLVHGELRFDESKLPEVDFENQQDTPPDTFIPATLEGNALGLEGYSHPVEHDITLNVRCFGPWCGGAVSDIKYLAFLKKTDEGYTLELDPCGGMGFGEPSEEQLNQAAQCMRGEACEEKKY